MSDHDHGHLKCFLEEEDEFIELCRNDGIKPSRRFIEDKNFWTKCECTRNRSAFFMPPESSWGCSLPKSASPTTANFIHTTRSTIDGASRVCSRRGNATLSSTVSELNRA